MPPRSFVSSVYWASPGERRSRSFESTPCRNACAPLPADLHLSHVRDVEEAGGRAHGAHLVDHARVLHGHLPTGEGDEAPARFRVACVQRRAL